MQPSRKKSAITPKLVCLALIIAVIVLLAFNAITIDLARRLTDRFSPRTNEFAPMSDPPIVDGQTIKLFLCGDVMTGRGIDQALEHSNDPLLFESYVKSAEVYVELAERANGPIDRPIDSTHIWGHALSEFKRYAPDVKIINLETSITTSDQPWPDKGIHYRMHPGNIACLIDAGIDCCTIANNHVLDWGYPGLDETLNTLQTADINYAGAGRTKSQAAAPAIMEVGNTSRVIVFAFGFQSSGIYQNWAATDNRAGVNLLPDGSSETVRRIARQVEAVERSGDIVVASIHWGDNWGYEIPAEQMQFARRLIDQASIDVIYGHSSHHPKAIEIYRQKPILYGCGDFINDYEGIGGKEEYRADLSLMYFLTIDTSTGNLRRLELSPTRIKRFGVQSASSDDARWMKSMLNRECGKFGVQVQLDVHEASLSLRW